MTTSSVLGQPAIPGCIACWGLDTGTEDSMGLHNASSSANVTYTYAGGRQGSGTTTYATANGSSTYIALPNDAAMKMTNPCVSFWIKTSTTDVDAICNNFAYVSSKYYGFGLWITSSAPAGRIEMISARGTGNVASTDYSVAFSSSTVNDNNWHHCLVGHKASDKIYFYIDGVLDNTYNWAYSCAYTTNHYPRIFCRNDTGSTNSDWFSGSLDSVTWIDTADISSLGFAKMVYAWARGKYTYGDSMGMSAGLSGSAGY